MLIYQWLSSLLINIVRGIRRAIDVKRKGCGDRGTLRSNMLTHFCLADVIPETPTPRTQPRLTS